MTNLTDTKPKACNGDLMRRTDSHVISNSKVDVSKSGDNHISPPKRNLSINAVPDSDPRWGIRCEEQEDS